MCGQDALNILKNVVFRLLRGGVTFQIEFCLEKYIFLFNVQLHCIFGETVLILDVDKGKMRYFAFSYQNREIKTLDRIPVDFLNILYMILWEL